MQQDLGTRLQANLDKDEQLLAEKRKQHELLSKELAGMEQNVEYARKKLKEYEENPIQISDHAYKRYFERVKGYDIAKIKAGIISPEILQQCLALGSGEFPAVVEGIPVTLVIQNKKIVTIKTDVVVEPSSVFTHDEVYQLLENIWSTIYAKIGKEIAKIEGIKHTDFSERDGLRTAQSAVCEVINSNKLRLNRKDN